MDKRTFDMSDPLYQYDAGTDAGLNFKSTDSPIPVNSTDRVVKMLQRAGNDITSLNPPTSSASTLRGSALLTMSLLLLTRFLS
ncbi:MAG: hypothetical protein MHM6MM_006415 [Cercozoa sp. M6MM]